MLSDPEADVFQLRIVGRYPGDELPEDVDWTDWMAASPTLHLFEAPLPEDDLSLAEATSVSLAYRPER